MRPDQLVLVTGRPLSRSALTAGDSPDHQRLLGAVHAAGGRLRCSCARAPEMVVRHLASGRYTVARLPDGGISHDPQCPSHTGALVPRRPSSIALTGSDTFIHLSTPLVDGTGASGAAGSDRRVGGARSQSRVTLLGLMERLWEDAGLHRWHPAMAHKRTWGVVHRHLLKAAGSVTVYPDRPLAGVLWVPEPFHAERVDTQHAVFAAWLARATSATPPQRPWAIVLGELKSAHPERSGDIGLTLRHLPRCRFLMPENVWQRLLVRWPVTAQILDGHDPDDAPRRRLMAALVCRPTGDRRQMTAATAAVMATSREWIPVASRPELVVADQLVDQHRAFYKPLRRSADTRVHPDFVLIDTRPWTPLEVYGMTANSEYEHRKKAKLAFYASTDRPSWAWDLASQPEPPAFPPAAGRPAANRT